MRFGRRIARVAAVWGVALAGLAACHRTRAPALPAGAALKVEMGRSTKLDPDAALRCFVHGQFVGMQTPAECASKNGIAPGALDVGLDQSGALAAGGGDTVLQPLANLTDNETAEADAGPEGGLAGVTGPDRPGDDIGRADDGREDGGAGAIGQVDDCLRFGRSGWRDAGRGVTLNACVHTLFDGRCVAPGQAVFGRWGGQTLRLVPGRVAISADNRNFRPLLSQDPGDCSISGG